MGDKNEDFWKGFLKAVETEPREAKPIRGASGLYHPVVALGVDDARNRVVIVSGDPDARSAVLAQNDIQANIPAAKVVVARPIALNLGLVAEAVVRNLGKADIGVDDLNSTKLRGKKKKHHLEAMKSIVETGKSAFKGLSHAKLNPLAAWQDVILQLSHLELADCAIETQLNAPDKTAASATQIIKLGNLVALDPAEVDRRVGLCSVPLYELSDAEAEAFQRNEDIGQIQEALKRINVFQYFYPPSDQLALALVDSNVAAPSAILENLQFSSDIGHPLAEPELLSRGTPTGELLYALEEKGYCVEGEFGLELTDKGRVTRATLRFKPREGFLAKLSRLFSIKLDLKDLFK